MTSKATKRMHVIKEVLNDFVLPEGDQEIVQIISSCGSNLHQVASLSPAVLPKWGFQLIFAISPFYFLITLWARLEKHIKREESAIFIDEGVHTG